METRARLELIQEQATIELGDLCISDAGVASSEIQDKLKSLPVRPGVYLMRDAESSIIYVGKAASLRHRVSQYFGARGGHSPGTRRMIPLIRDISFIVTDSEVEALVLESVLIKRHRPKYNVRLRDDKQYPYLKVTVQETWPRVCITRKVLNDGARYFGPYTNAYAVREVMWLLRKIFPYRSCRKEITGEQSRPCLNYFIGRCLGPCAGSCEETAYREVINEILMFLQGHQKDIADNLRREMEEASERMEFERAAVLRDRLRAVERVTEEKQKVVSVRGGDQDVIGLARNMDEASVMVFLVREGLLLEQRHFLLQGTQDQEDSEIVESFVKQFYDLAPYVPKELMLPVEIDDENTIKLWLAEKREGPVRLTVPKQGDKHRLVMMATENARQALEQAHIAWLAASDKTTRALLELQQYLELDAPPDRIECYDISNIQGSMATGSMVVFEAGQRKNSDYRRFRIKTVQGADDYSMLQEVLRRRFKRVSDGDDEQGDSWRSIPDLIIMDGGKGQLSAALEVLRELDLTDLQVVGLAKEREEIFLPERGDPVMLPRSSEGLYLVQRIRDEAHRFAVTYHRKLRGKKTLQSPLDDVPGIGPKRKRALLKHFGSLKAINEASMEEIAQVEGMTLAQAKKLKENL